MTCNLRFWDNNGLSQDYYDTGRISYSSQLTAFPFTNALDDFRAKVWIPAGNFDITAQNNQLYVESLTASLSIGSYLPAALVTEIQSKLNAIDSGWSVTYSSNKFTLSNSGSKTIDLSSTANAVWDTIGFAGSTDRTGTSFAADERRNHTSEWFQIDFGVPFTVTCMGIISLLDKQFPFSSGARITIKGNNVDLWDTPPIEVTLNPSARGIIQYLDDFTESQKTMRYWRVEYQDKQNPLGNEGIDISKIYIGNHGTTDINITSGFSKNVVDPSNQQQSESGTQYFDEKVKYQAIRGMTYQVISQDDRVYLEQLYQDYGRTIPLFVSIDPTAQVSVDASEFTYFGYFESDPNFQNLFRDKWSMNFNFREAV
jgi:hypothetical protein